MFFSYAFLHLAYKQFRQKPQDSPKRPKSTDATTTTIRYNAGQAQPSGRYVTVREAPSFKYEWIGVDDDSATFTDIISARTRSHG
jgi:hypothetical protein